MDKGRISFDVNRYLFSKMLFSVSTHRAIVVQSSAAKIRQILSSVGQSCFYTIWVLEQRMFIRVNITEQRGPPGKRIP